VDRQIFRPTRLYQLQLQTAFRRIEAGMENGAVGLRSPGKNISALLDDDHLRTGQSETTGDRTADNSGTDDGNVEFRGEALDHRLPFTFVVQKRNQQT